MIVWGTKRVEKRLGYVAEHCPRCQGLRCIKVVRLGMAGHVYFIALNSGRLLAHIGRCEQCSGEFIIEPALYSDLEKNRKRPVEEIAARTNPLLGASAEQQKKELRLRSVCEPFLRFNQSIEDRAGKGTHLDWHSGLAILGTVLLTGVFGFSAAAAEPNARSAELLTMFAVLTFLGGFIYSLWAMSKEPERHFRKKLLPQIHIELEALRADRTEVDEGLQRLARYRYRIAKLVRPHDRVAGFVRA